MKKSIAFFTSILTVAFIIATVIISSIGFTANATGQPGKKEHKVKVLVKEDGKLIEKDTTVVKGRNAVILVEKGMTTIADSIYHGMGNDLKNKVVTVTVTDDNAVEGQTSSFSYSIGDTLQSDVQRKVIRLGDGKKTIIMQDAVDGHFGQSVTSQPESGKVIFRKNRDPFAFDPSDSNIVSYKKKDAGKGLEKITIVRRKEN